MGMKDVFSQHFKPNTKMKNFLKVSALAFVFAAALTSCESKPAAEGESTTTTEMSTDATAPATGDTTSMSADSAATSAPSDGTSTSTTTTTTQE